MKYWTTIYRTACVLLALIIALALIGIFAPRFNNINRLQEQKTSIKEENLSLESKAKKLRKKQERFTSDPKYVERVAREELHMAKPGETIFRFETNNTAGPH